MMQSFNLGQIKTRLLTSSAFVLGITALVPVVQSKAPLLVEETIKTIISIISGIVANDLGSIADRLGKNENVLVNHDLSKAVGDAMGAVILSVAKSGKFPNQKKTLEKLAKTAANHWQDIAEENTFTKNVDLQAIQETQLSAIFSTDAKEFGRLKVLSPAAWEHILNKLKEKAKLDDLCDDLVKRVAKELHNTFAQALREVLKHDFNNGGKAFAGMVLSLLGEIKAEIIARQQEIINRLNEMEIKQGGEALKEIIERLESFTQLKVGTPSATLAFGQFSRQMTTVLDNLQEVNQTTQYIRENIEEIKEAILELRTNPQRKTPVSFKQFLRAVAFRSCAVTILLVVLRFLGIFQQMELKSFDLFMRWRPDEGQDKRLLVIAIREEDIKAQNRSERADFSISDRKLNQLLAKLENYQPRIIGLDLYRKKTYLEELKIRLGRNNVFGVCKVFSDDAPDTDKTKSPSPPEIAKHRKGFSDVLPDKDEIVRRHLLQMKPPNTDAKCPTDDAFSLQLALHYLQKELGWSSNNDLMTGDAVFQRIKTPTTGGYPPLLVDTNGYQVLLNYRTHQNSPQQAIMQVNLEQVLEQNGLDAVENLSKRIVLIGVTSENRDNFSQPDIFSTPYGEDMPGVVLQAQMISQIISAVEDGRSLLWVWSQWGEWLWIGAWSFLGAILAVRFRKFPSLALAEGVAFIGLGGICFVFLLDGGWIPFVPPALALVMTGMHMFVHIIKSQ